MAQLSLAELKAGRPVAAQSQEIGFTSVEGFAALQRMANMFTQSSMVPQTFQGQQNLGNAAIALDMAIRMQANPLMVMQNLYVVHGRPSWSAQFLIATLNKSGKFSALRYEFQGKEGADDWGCCACATELATQEVLHGPLITIALAKKEGWYSKKDKYGNETSKWQTMPELMLRYRAASWFVRAYAPEIAMGLPEAEELRDVIDITPEGEVVEPPKETTTTVEEVKAKARRKKVQPVEAVREEQPEPVEQKVEEAVEEQIEQQPDTSSEPTIICPSNGKPVALRFCSECDERRGCPAHAINDEQEAK